MLKNSPVFQRLSSVFGQAEPDDTFLDQYEPTPLSRPAGAWTDEAVQDRQPQAPTTNSNSERLESKTLSMIRGALYTAE